MEPTSSRYDHLFGPYGVQLVASASDTLLAGEKAPAEDKYVVTSGGDGILNAFLAAQFPTDASAMDAMEPLASARLHDGGAIVQLAAGNARCVSYGADGKLVLVDSVVPMRHRPIGAISDGIASLTLNGTHVAYASKDGGVFYAAIPNADASIESWASVPIEGPAKQAIRTTTAVHVVDLHDVKKMRTEKLEKEPMGQQPMAWNGIGTMLAFVNNGRVCIASARTSDPATVLEDVKEEVVSVLWSRTRGTLVLLTTQADLVIWNYYLRGEAGRDRLPTDLLADVKDVRLAINPTGSMLWVLDGSDGKLLTFVLTEVTVKETLFDNDNPTKENSKVEMKRKFVPKPDVPLSLEDEDDDKPVKKKKKQQRLTELIGGSSHMASHTESEIETLDEGECKDFGAFDQLELAADRPVATRQQFLDVQGKWRGDARWLAHTPLGKVIQRRTLASDHATSMSVDVEFHDSRAHRPIRFVDDLHVTCCAFPTHAPGQGDGILFASDRHVKYVPIPSPTQWCTRRVWLEEVPVGETCESVALLGTHMALVLMNQGSLRAYTTAGIFLMAMAAPLGAFRLLGSQEQLLIVCQLPSGLQTHVWKLREDGNIAPIMSASMPHKTFIWLGHDGSDRFGALDQEHCLHMLSMETSTWVVVSKPSSAGAYPWPIGFTLDPLPAMQAVKMVKAMDSPDPNGLFDLLETTEMTEQTALAIFLPANKTLRLQADKHWLEHMQTCIKADDLERALQCVHLLKTAKSLDVALQLAKHARLLSLVNRIEEVIAKGAISPAKSAISVASTTAAAASTATITSPQQKSTLEATLSPVAPTLQPPPPDLPPSSHTNGASMMFSTLESSGYDYSQLYRKGHPDAATTIATATTTTSDGLNAGMLTADSQATQLSPWMFSSQPTAKSSVSEANPFVTPTTTSATDSSTTNATRTPDSYLNALSRLMKK